MLFQLCFFILGVIIVSSQDLPTLYDYYTSDGIQSGLSVDQPYFTLNGKNISIYSGAMHYFRVPPDLWQDRLRKFRAAGLNAVETYVPWNLHEPRKGFFEFGSSGTDWEAFTDLQRFLTLAKEEDLLVIIRPGPYICAEWEWGGHPSWLLRENMTIRSADEKYVAHVEHYFKQLLPIIAKNQFTNGGPVIMVQVENEYAGSPVIELEYLQKLVEILRNNGIVEVLSTADGPGSTSGTIPDVLFATGNFGSDVENNFGKLKEMQPGKPLMAMEFYPGWADHWTEQHHTTDADTFRSNYEQALAYPGSVNIYMLHGATNFGFLNGANNYNGDNSGFQPITTSYDFDAPITENGNYTEKYYIMKELLEKYNPVKTLIPDPPIVEELADYGPIKIKQKMGILDIINNAPEKVISDKPLSMEQLPINDNNGQSYGYIVYRTEGGYVKRDTVLKITGHIQDTLLVLADGTLESPPLSSSDDFDNFGYWRASDHELTFKEEYFAVTLDLIVENWGRVHHGSILYQPKGFISENKIEIGGNEVTSWSIYPLEFTSSWINTLQYAQWDDANTDSGPALYKTTLTITDPDGHIKDTYLDMSNWRKGIVIVNGFVLGRYCFLGAQQALYLPGSFLHQGDNEIMVFEHFQGVDELKFSKNQIYVNN